MISAHLTKKTWLHQIPSSVKLIVLSFVTYFSTHIVNLINAMVMLSMSILIYLSLGQQARRKLLSLIKSFGTLVIFIGVVQCIFIPISFAALTSIKMFSLILLADLVSISTPLSELKRIILKLLTPLKLLGLNINKVSLTMTLSLRLIRVYIALWEKLDISLQARTIRKKNTSSGIQANNYKIKKLVIPFLFNSQHLTFKMAEALHARLKK